MLLPMSRSPSVVGRLVITKSSSGQRFVCVCMASKTSWSKLVCCGSLVSIIIKQMFSCLSASISAVGIGMLSFGVV